MRFPHEYGRMEAIRGDSSLTLPQKESMKSHEESVKSRVSNAISTIMNMREWRQFGVTLPQEESMKSQKVSVKSHVSNAISTRI